MREDFRVVLPECVELPSPYQPDRVLIRSVNTVLWSGQSMPTREILDPLIEGQVYYQQPSEFSEDVIRYLSSPNLMIQQRRRVRLLGWATIGAVNVQTGEQTGL